MNSFDMNRRAATLATVALAGIGLAAATLPQVASAQTGAPKPSHTMPGAPG